MKEPNIPLIISTHDHLVELANAQRGWVKINHAEWQDHKGKRHLFKWFKEQQGYSRIEPVKPPLEPLARKPDKPTIVIDLAYFVDLAVHTKEYAIVNEIVANAILIQRNNLTICHLEPCHTCEKDLEHLHKYFQLWRITEWKVSINRRTKVKEQADMERQKRLEKLETLDELRHCLVKNLGINWKIANRIIEDKLETGIKDLGKLKRALELFSTNENENENENAETAETTND